MTLTKLTPEEKLAHRKAYKTEYNTKYYQWQKENDPEAYRKRVDADTERAKKRYYAKKEAEGKPAKKFNKTNIKINLPI